MPHAVAVVSATCSAWSPTSAVCCTRRTSWSRRAPPKACRDPSSRQRSAACPSSRRTSGSSPTSSGRAACSSVPMHGRATSRLLCGRCWTTPATWDSSVDSTPPRRCAGMPSCRPGWTCSRPCHGLTSSILTTVARRERGCSGPQAGSPTRLGTHPPARSPARWPRAGARRIVVRRRRRGGRVPRDHHPSGAGDRRCRRRLRRARRALGVAHGGAGGRRAAPRTAARARAVRGADRSRPRRGRPDRCAAPLRRHLSPHVVGAPASRAERSTAGAPGRVRRVGERRRRRVQRAAEQHAHAPRAHRRVVHDQPPRHARRGGGPRRAGRGDLAAAPSHPRPRQVGSRCPIVVRDDRLGARLARHGDAGVRRARSVRRASACGRRGRRQGAPAGARRARSVEPRLHVPGVRSAPRWTGLSDLPRVRRAGRGRGRHVGDDAIVELRAAGAVRDRGAQWVVAVRRHARRDDGGVRRRNGLRAATGSSTRSAPSR